MTNPTEKFVMPRVLRKKWLAALRSGKYKQGTGKLYKPNEKSFCCLGVLEHCAMDGQVETYGVGQTWTDNNFKSVPSMEFLEKFNIVGLRTEFGRSHMDNLIDMNDGLDAYRKGSKSFKQIANYIEANSRGR